MSTTAYRLLDVGAARLAVASPIECFHDDLDRVYPHQEPIAEPMFADVRVTLLPGSRFRPRGRQVTLWADGQRPFEPYPHDSALPLFEWGSNYLLSQRLNAHLLLHAGVVARGERALILPASPGAGKTTLTCALHLAGWRFLSDEFGVIDLDTGELLPMLRPAPLKNRSIDVIARRPGAILGPLFPKTRKGDVAHFVPSRESFADRHRRASPALIVFPRFQAGAALRCTHLRAGEAALRVGLNSFNYRALGPLGFEAVVSMLRRTVACELIYGELDGAIAHIEALFERLP